MHCVGLVHCARVRLSPVTLFTLLGPPALCCCVQLLALLLNAQVLLSCHAQPAAQDKKDVPQRRLCKPCVGPQASCVRFEGVQAENPPSSFHRPGCEQCVDSG